jgi:uncharacterized protein
MPEHPNATRVRRLADAFMRGDLDQVLDSYADDAVYRVGGRNLVTGNYKGRQAIQDFFIHLGQITDGTMRLELHDAIGAEGHAVMFWGLTAEREGKSIDAKGAMAFKVGDDGRFTESWFLYDDQRAYDEFFS